MYNFDELPDSAFVRLKTVCLLFQIAPATVWRRCADGSLPKPRKFGSRVTCWSVAELRAVLRKLKLDEFEAVKNGIETGKKKIDPKFRAIQAAEFVKEVTQ